MGAFINDSDLAPFATIDPDKAAAMIADAEAMAVITAPCLHGLLVGPPDETAEDRALREAKLDAARAILRGAILRWDEAGSGALSSRMETVGPFGQQQTIDTRQARKTMFWPSDIEALQNLCSPRGGAFETDTMPADAGDGYWRHPDWWVPLPGPGATR